VDLQEAVGQHAALEKVPQLAFDESRHGSGAPFGGGEKGQQLFRDHAVQDGFLGAPRDIFREGGVLSIAAGQGHGHRGSDSREAGRSAVRFSFQGLVVEIPVLY